MEYRSGRIILDLPDADAREDGRVPQDRLCSHTIKSCLTKLIKSTGPVPTGWFKTRKRKIGRGPEAFNGGELPATSNKWSFKDVQMRCESSATSTVDYLRTVSDETLGDADIEALGYIHIHITHKTGEGDRIFHIRLYYAPLGQYMSTHRNV